MCVGKYPSIFPHQMEAIVYILLRSHFDHESNPVLAIKTFLES